MVSSRKDKIGPKRGLNALRDDVASLGGFALEKG